VVQVETPCNSIELLATVVNTLEAHHHDRQGRIRTGTAPVAVAHPRGAQRAPSGFVRTSPLAASG
jgi:hypothetical protein